VPESAAADRKGAILVEFPHPRQVTTDTSGGLDDPIFPEGTAQEVLGGYGLRMSPSRGQKPRVPAEAVGAPES
jgi:hypothetical protein